MAKESQKYSSSPTHEDIARRAYEIFVERGRPEGRDLEHWLAAEAELNVSHQQDSRSDLAVTRSSGASQPAASSRRFSARGQ